MESISRCSLLFFRRRRERKKVSNSAKEGEPLTFIALLAALSSHRINIDSVKSFRVGIILSMINRLNGSDSTTKKDNLISGDEAEKLLDSM